MCSLLDRDISLNLTTHSNLIFIPVMDGPEHMIRSRKLTVDTWFRSARCSRASYTQKRKKVELFEGDKSDETNPKGEQLVDAVTKITFYIAQTEKNTRRK